MPGRRGRLNAACNDVCKWFVGADFPDDEASAGLSRREGIPSLQLRDQPKVAVARQKLFDAMRKAQRCNARIVNDTATHATVPQRRLEDRKETTRLDQRPYRRRRKPGFDLVGGLVRRARGRVPDPRIGCDTEELENAGPWNSPRLMTLREIRDSRQRERKFFTPYAELIFATIERADLIHQQLMIASERRRLDMETALRTLLDTFRVHDSHHHRRST